MDQPEALLPMSQGSTHQLSQPLPEPGSEPLANARHERFAQELVKGASAAEAYRLAGYEHNEGNCIRLKGNEGVQERIGWLKRASVAKHAVTSERIIAELALIGFARMADYIPLIEGGDLSSITHEQSAPITEISTDTVTTGVGRRRKITKRVKLKLAAKREALVDLGKITGLFDDRPDITVPVTFRIERTERSRRDSDEE